MSKKKRSFAPKGSGPVGDINVTPLIDVVLVLLIIYMVVTPIMLNQCRSISPKKQNGSTRQAPKGATVAACSDGQFALNRVVLPLPERRQSSKDHSKKSCR